MTDEREENPAECKLIERAREGDQAAYGALYQQQVRVSGTLDEEAQALVFEREDDEINIKVKLPQRTGKGKGSVLRVQVPRTVELDIKGISTAKNSQVQKR